MYLNKSGEVDPSSAQKVVHEIVTLGGIAVASSASEAERESATSIARAASFGKRNGGVHVIEAPGIQIDDSGNGLVRITINRPQKHNALARPVLDALAAAVGKAGSDMDTRCILIRGAGDKYFAAGGDLVDLASVRTEAEINAMGDQATAALDVVRECPVPVIAYVNGDALGGGAELALACDMRLIAPHARIGFIHGRMGITSAWGGGADLCALIGPPRAMRMMARCEMIDATLSIQWGLADVEVRDGAEGNEVSAFLKPMLERSALLARGVKAQTLAWRKGQDRAMRREVERAHLLSTWASADHWAAVERFLARDKP